MPGPVTHTGYDVALEQHAMRKHGLLGRGKAMGNALYAIDYDCLPPKARTTIKLIIDGGPFDFKQDGSPFGNKFGDLPEGQYLEYTVRTPGCISRGGRRIVARKRTGQLFFTACHYERVQVTGGTKSPQAKQARIQATAAIDAEYRNGFYVITGMPLALRDSIVAAVKVQG